MVGNDKGKHTNTKRLKKIPKSKKEEKKKKRNIYRMIQAQNPLSATTSLHGRLRNQLLIHEPLDCRM